MITYNHEKYIADAIKGILLQKISFPTELIIADDYSTDKTRFIVQQVLLGNTGNITIEYFRNEKNVGPQKNWFRAYDRCRGKYIALCEGDDYWTDPLKLQKQVDFLESNDDYVISCHNAIIIDDKSRVINPSKVPVEQQRDFMKTELMKITPVLTLTSVFRNRLDNFPSSLRNSPNGDTTIFSYLGQFGKSKFHRDIKYAVYRVHEGGIWSTKSQGEKNRMQLQTFSNLAQYFKNTVHKEVWIHFQKRVLYVNILLINETTSWAKIYRIFMTVIWYLKRGEPIESLRLVSIFLKNRLISLKRTFK